MKRVTQQPVRRGLHEFWSSFRLIFDIKSSNLRLSSASQRLTKANNKTNSTHDQQWSQMEGVCMNGVKSVYECMK